MAWEQRTQQGLYWAPVIIDHCRHDPSFCATPAQPLLEQHLCPWNLNFANRWAHGSASKFWMLCIILLHLLRYSRPSYRKHIKRYKTLAVVTANTLKKSP